MQYTLLFVIHTFITVFISVCFASKTKVTAFSAKCSNECSFLLTEPISNVIGKEGGDPFVLLVQSSPQRYYDVYVIVDMTFILWEGTARLKRREVVTSIFLLFPFVPKIIPTQQADLTVILLL